MSHLTTLRVGGTAALVAECAATEVLVDAVRLLDRQRVPTLLLGGGSNMLVADSGFDGVVVRIANAAIDIGDNHVHTEAGANLDDIVATVASTGLGGMECLSGIPGSIGATPIQNVGAYGVEVSDLLRRVRLLDRTTGDDRWCDPAELGLGYRTSVLKHSDRAVVLAVEFDLNSDGLSAELRYDQLALTLSATAGTRLPTLQVREAVLRLRKAAGMVLDPDDPDTCSAGSFFTFPLVTETVAARIQDIAGMTKIPTYACDGGVKLDASYLIDLAGFPKGFPGPQAAARVSTKHTLALTNRGSARTDDLLRLAREVRDGVEEKFGVRLVLEPVTVGVTL